MTHVNLSEARAHLGRYLKRVEKGERIVLCERNRPVAEIRPIAGAGERRPLKLGVLRGVFEVPEDFNEPSNEFERDFYGD